MRRVFTVATLILGALAALGASQHPGSISGVFTDTTGRGLPGATIAVASEDDGTRTAVTDSTGRYHVDGLTPGRHRIEASMAGFETKVTEVSVFSGRTVVWSGALLVGPVVIGGASIERQVMRFTGSDALDCGRHGAASGTALRRSLACGLTSARAGQPFSVIVQFAARDTQGGHGLLAGSDGVIRRFEYERKGSRFRLQQCPSPQVTPGPNRSGAEFTC